MQLRLNIHKTTNKKKLEANVKVINLVVFQQLRKL